MYKGCDGLKKKLFYKILSYVFLFFAFSIVGYIWETCLKLVQMGVLVNSGTLFGPWLPIYGCGGLAVLILLDRFKKKPILVFVLSLVVCTLIEYFTSCYLEFTKGVRYWDYSHYFININGRVCLEGAIIFGLAGCVVMYIGGPLFLKFFKKIPHYLKVVVCFSLITLFICDNIYSHFHPNTGEGITYTEKENT